MTLNITPISILRMQTEAIKASMDNHANTRELALAKTKIEECMMWLNQHLLLNPESSEMQGELPLFAKQEEEAAPVKKKTVKAKPEAEVVQPHATAQEALSAQPKIETAHAVQLPTKEEMIQLAKDYGKKNGIEAFLNLLKPFNCKNISELYEAGTEAVQKFYGNLNK